MQRAPHQGRSRAALRICLSRPTAQVTLRRGERLSGSVLGGSSSVRNGANVKNKSPRAPHAGEKRLPRGLILAPSLSLSLPATTRAEH